MIYTPDLYTLTMRKYNYQTKPNEMRNSKEDFPRRHFKFTFIYFVYCVNCAVQVIAEKCLCFKRAENHEQNAEKNIKEKLNKYAIICFQIITF